MRLLHMSYVRIHSQTSPLWRFSLFGMILMSTWCATAEGASPKFAVLRRDEIRSAGVLQGTLEDGFRVQEIDADTISLDQIKRLELPLAVRVFPDRGWKYLTLTNGDRLHAKQMNVVPADEVAGANADQLVSTQWFAEFGSPLNLSQANLARVSQPIDTEVSVYQDFETDAAGWLNLAGGPIATDGMQGRSGSHSMKSSGDQPALRYELADALERGWLEFSFFVKPDTQDRGSCVASVSLSSSELKSAIQIELTAETPSYAVTLPPEGTWRRQNVPRRAGWHTVRLSIQAGQIRLLLDNYLLADGKLSAASHPKLLSLGFTSDRTAPEIWIDDFAVTRWVTGSGFEVLNRAQEQVDFTNGNQLFGQLKSLDPKTLVLQSGSQQTVVNWSEIRSLQLAAKQSVTQAVAGRIVSLEMQPWNCTFNLLVVDRLTGALVATDEGSCVLEHPLCGRLTIPWRHIRQVDVGGLGQLWMLEGLPHHLGDEIKSTFHKKIPDGLRLLRTMDVAAGSEGIATVSLTAGELEPSGPGTLDHPWLKRLRGGELTSELWLNDRRIAVLNDHISGKRSVGGPQQLRFQVPLQPGRNRFEIRLNPTRGEAVQYDDWELQEWRVELTKPRP